jgi:hypothetical protein
MGVAYFAGAWVGNFPTFSRSYQAEEPDNDGNGIGDYARGNLLVGGLLTRAYFAPGPQHGWIDEGKNLRKHPEQIPVWGGVGWAGYYAGPNAQIVDKFALTDPLLARLPIPDARYRSDYRIGHYERKIPEGYVESLSTGTNVLQHPSLFAYYDKLRLVTRGPLFSPARWLAIAKLNLGLYDHYLEDYLADYNKKRVTIANVPPKLAVPAGSEDDASEPYDWSSPGARNGVAFSEWGVRIYLGTTSAPALRLAGTPGRYDLAFVREGVVVGKSSVLLPADGSAEIDVPPLEGARGIDAVDVVPAEGRGIRKITYFELLPRSIASTR